MKNPQYPSRLRSKADRAIFDRVVRDLARHDLDPSSRLEIITDFCEAERTIASLRRDTKGGTMATRLAATRALNVATAERRRLHQRLFAGGRRPEEALPSVEVAADAISNDADEAWRVHYQTGRGLRLMGDAAMQARVSAHEVERAALEARHGPANWMALLYGSAEEQVAADRAIAAYGVRNKNRSRVESAPS